MRARPVRSLVLATLLTALFLWPATPVRADVTVSIGAGGVSPSQLSIAVGESVTFQNNDSERHRIRSDSDPPFDTGNLDAGESATVLFSTAGSFPFLDEEDDDDTRFRGTITVGGSGGGGAGGADPGAAPGGTAGQAPPPQVSVTIADSTFRPASVVVATGGSVVWTNSDDREHTATAAGGAFDSGDLATGARFSQVFATAGTFPYFCAIHPDMRGTVTVGSGAASASPGAPPAAGGAGTGEAATGGTPGRRAVSIVDFSFQPATVNVTVGSTVAWTNNGQARHTATAEGGGFDSGRMDSRATFEHTFAAPGRFAYRCDLHPEMLGEVVVSTVAGAPPPAGGDGDDATADADADGAATTAEVEVQDFDFDPPELTVGEGTQVTWQFTGRATHTVTAEDGAFDSGEKEQGDAFQQTFTSAGRYPYVCAIHPRMKGTIVVVQGDDVVPTGSGGGGFDLAKSAGIGLVALPGVFLLLAWALWLRPRSS